MKFLDVRDKNPFQIVHVIIIGLKFEKLLKVEPYFACLVIIKLLKNVIFDTYKIFEPNCINNLKEVI